MLCPDCVLKVKELAHRRPHGTMPTLCAHQSLAVLGTLGVLHAQHSEAMHAPGLLYAATQRRAGCPAQVVLARRGKGGEFGALTRANTELIPASRPDTPPTFPTLPPALGPAYPAPLGGPSGRAYDALLQLQYAAARWQGPAHAGGAPSRLGQAWH